VPRNADAAAEVDKWWPGGDVVGFCPFGASKKRRLPLITIKHIVSSILNNSDARVWLVVPPNDLVNLRYELSDESWFHRLLFQPTADFMDLFEAVARCRAMVSVDTALVHLASGLRLPLLALYAGQRLDSENILAWHPNFEAAISLVSSDLSAEDLSAFDTTELASSVKRLLS
jgi:ADP-heptose:LPS heptosyltransferase